MVTPDASVNREKVINFRLSADEAQQLQEVAAHRGLDTSSVLRMLVKKEHDRMQIEKRIAAEPFQLDAQHADVLRAMHEDGAPISRDDLAVQLNRWGHEARLRWLPRTLNDLTRNGYLRRLTSGYAITEKETAVR